MSGDYPRRGKRAARPSARVRLPRTPSGAALGIHTPLTDLGNAERLVHRHGDALRYCTPLRAWFIWDGIRWKRDEIQQVMTFATETVRAIYREAEDADTKDQAEDISKHASRSEGAARLSALVRLAEAQPRVAIRPDELDSDGWLLNVLNGTLDLRTGDIRESRREDLITKLAPVEYNADARSELWDDYLKRTTIDDEDMEGFLRRCAGYTLTGDTREDRLFFVHGPTGSGKSTFINALKAVMGDYAIQTSFETFLAKKFAGGATNDIADLVGARLLVSIEVDEGKKLAEAMVKQITGGDTVRARQLYQTNFEFKPQLKLWLIANQKPRVSDEDDAIWRRILRIPFENSLPEDRRDKTVRPRLSDPAESGPAILAWAVRGCIEWQEHGLMVPEIVKRKTVEYRAEMDPLADFLTDRCEIAEGATASKSDLWNAYVAYAQSSGIRFPLIRPEFTKRIAGLANVGESRAGHGGTRVWKGIALLGEGRMRREDNLWDTETTL